MSTATKSILLLLFGSGIASTQGFAFVPTRPTARSSRTSSAGRRRPLTTTPTTTSTTTSQNTVSLSMLPPVMTDFDLDLPVLMSGILLSDSSSSAATSLATTLATTAAAAAATSTSNGQSLLQAEVLNGMAHALLDFTTLFGAATVVIRLSAVLGRLVVMAQDFAPGHTALLPDEIAFQFGLLAIACHGLSMTLWPKIKAHWLCSSPLMTSQDRQAFRSLFRPAGITWPQYKELAMASMDWVHVEPGEIIMSEEDDHVLETNPTKATTAAPMSDNKNAVYWLYKGDVHVLHNGTVLHKISGDGHYHQEIAGLGLLGETRLAELLDRRNHLKYHHNSNPTTSSTSTMPSKKKRKKITAVAAGESGATLLRIDTTKLEKLLQHDPELTYSVSRLAFKGMQDKVDALLMFQNTTV